MIAGCKSEVYFKVDAGPDQEPVESIKYFCDAGVLGGLGDNACKRVLYFLQLFDMGIMYSIEYGVAIVYAASDYRIGHRYGSIHSKCL